MRNIDRKKRNDRLVFVIIFSIFFASIFLNAITTYLLISKNLNEKKVAKADDGSGLIINSNFIGPFDDNSGDITLILNIKSSVYYSSIRETFVYGTDPNNIAYSSSKAVHSVNANGEYEVSWTFPGRQIALYGKRYIRITISDVSRNTKLFERYTTLYKIGKETVNGNRYLNSIWSGNTICFQIVNSSFSPISDSFYFRDTVDFLAVDYYYRLDLSSIGFLFSSRSKTYEKAELSFDDEDNLFPLINKDNNGSIHIPLEIEIDGESRINFIFQHGFYVNPSNLEMSSQYINGFRPTNYFYLPINKLSNINDYKFSISIYGIGLNKTNVSLTLDYDISQNLIGRCDSSDYCVVGGTI